MVPARPQETHPPSLYGAYLENGTGTTFRRATDAPRSELSCLKNCTSAISREGTVEGEGPFKSTLPLQIWEIVPARPSQPHLWYRPDLPRSHLSSMRPLLPQGSVPARSSEDPSRFPVAASLILKGVPARPLILSLSSTPLHSL
jgi:hypothetical protein